MRKFTLLLAFLAFTAMSFAQKAETGFSEGKTLTKAKAERTETKAFGDVIWSEDFNSTKWSGTVVADDQGYLLNTAVELPEGWTIVDNNELDYFWHWSDVGPRGRWTAGQGAEAFVPQNDIPEAMPEGTSYANGFMMIESDYYNTTEGGEMSSNNVDMDGYIQYGPINLTDAPGAVFSVKTIYRTCCSADALMALYISTDYNATSGEGTWTEQVLNVFTNNNEYTLTSERDMHVNISSLVAGESNVWFRIHKKAASHYFALIDDISIYEPPTSDLILTDAWADYMYDAEDPDFLVDSGAEDASWNFWGGYTQIPVSVVSNFIKFRAAVNNNGTTDATNAKVNVSITKDGSEDYSVASAGQNVDKFTKDTLRVVADYTPADKAAYQVSMTVTFDETDEAPANNGWEYNFEVVEDVYSRVYHGNEDADYYAAGPRDWASGGYDGDVCAQPFDFGDIGNIKVKGVKVWVDDYTGRDDEMEAIENGDFAMIARLYSIDDAGDIVDAGIASEVYTVEVSDTATWVMLDFKDDGNLVIQTDQTYYAGIECYTGTEQVLRFQIGADGELKQPVDGGLIYLYSQGGWYRTGDNYAIDLVLDTDPVPTVQLTFNVDMSNAEDFTPGTDVVYVTGSFSGWTEPGQDGSVMMTDDDSDMVYTATVEVEQNQTVEYKYFKNAGWNGGEWAEEINREAVIVESDVTVNDLWGVIGINTNYALNVTVAPNPFNNELVVNNLENVAQIRVSNVLGQTVMTVNVDELTEVIATSDLRNGIYMVTIIDNNNNVRTERVVKQ